MGISFIKPWYSADLAMEVLENSMSDRRMSDASLIDSLATILISHGRMTRPADTDIWEPSYWLKDRMLTWSNVTAKELANYVAFWDNVLVQVSIKVFLMDGGLFNQALV